MLSEKKQVGLQIKRLIQIPYSLRHVYAELAVNIAYMLHAFVSCGIFVDFFVSTTTTVATKSDMTCVSPSLFGEELTSGIGHCEDGWLLEDLLARVGPTPMS